jgi:Xaa-Pro dipeptidase
MSGHTQKINKKLFTINPNLPRKENVMIIRFMIFLLSVMFTVPVANAQTEGYTPETEREILRLIRNQKLDLILPGAMRDNNVDMWIHVTRAEGVFANEESGDKLALHFGETSGYLIFTDLGDRIERAMFGKSAGSVERIDVRGSNAVNMALGGYNYKNMDKGQTFTIPDVYEEITQFIAERDPKTIAVNFSEWLPIADGISYTSYLKLQKIIGPKYSARMVSAENVISDFVVRRTSREIAAQTHLLTMARQRKLQRLSTIVPGSTSAREVGARVVYSAVSDRSATSSRGYTLQRGDLFYGGGGGGRYSHIGFPVDSKIYAYILKEGETKVPDFLQKVYDKAIAGQRIMRPHMRVGMTAGESLRDMVKAMEDEGYVYSPFKDDGQTDMIIQNVLANKGTGVAGFSIDNHALGNTGEVGPSMAEFRPDTHRLIIQENHIFAFEYMVHMNIAERPGYPLSLNISNAQVITSRGVENIQPPNEGIVLIY